MKFAAVLCTLFLSLCGIQPLRAATTLPTVKVVGTRVDSTFDTVGDLEQQRQVVPGGTNLIVLDNAAGLSTLSAALNYQPGVIVQEFFGGLDQPRLNVRGSGIQGNPVARGVLLRQDYLPLNEADGSFIIGLLDLRNMAMISVNRGANSRVPGSFTLGGDLNFISWQGETGTTLQLERGSFGQQSNHASHAGASNDTLYRVSASTEQADGFRHHSSSARQHYALSLAVPLNDRIQTQWYLNHAEIDFDMPFVLPRERAESEPESVFGDGDLPFDLAVNIYRRDPHRTTTQTRLANRTKVLTDAGEHSAGLYWQTTDDAFVDPFTHTETKTDTTGLQWTYDHTMSAMYSWQLGVDLNYSEMPRTFTGNDPLSGNKLAAVFGDLDLQADNHSLSLQADIRLQPQLTLNTQWQLGVANRDIDDEIGTAQDHHTWHYQLPKIGLIYRPTGGSRWYTNISRSVEVPTFWELVGIDTNPALTSLSTTRLLDIEIQKAVTLEAGMEQPIGAVLALQATVYRSYVEKELISTASQFGVIAETSNYDRRTIHQGIEFGFTGEQALGSGQLEYRLSWTWSDFYFDGGVFSDNQIAGVPENLIAMEILLQQGALKLGPNLRWVPDNNPVDHANTLGQGNYLLAGFRLDYQFERPLRCYLLLDNVFDERYNASYVVRAQSSAELPTYLPGNGASVLFGLGLEF